MSDDPMIVCAAVSFLEVIGALQLDFDFETIVHSLNDRNLFQDARQMTTKEEVSLLALSTSRSTQAL